MGSWRQGVGGASLFRLSPAIEPSRQGVSIPEFKGQEGRFDTLGKLVSAHLVGGLGTLAQRTSPTHEVGKDQ